MIDIQVIRDNPELVQKKADEKNIKVEIKKLLELYDVVIAEKTKLDEARQARNELTAKFKGVKPSDEQIEEGKKLREKVAKLEEVYTKKADEYHQVRMLVPNLHADDTPLGGEEANQPVKTRGEPVKQQVKDHQAWAEGKDYLDFERGAKVAGNKFYYTKGALVELELACIQLALNLAMKHGFTPMTVPHMVNEQTANGTGFSPRGEEDQIYSIAGEDLSLIATSEIPITGYHSGEIIDVSTLPILYAGLSPAYRKEAGAYGKHSKGLYRVHQFNKVEMYVFCEGRLEESEAWHQKLIEFEEELCQALEIPYQLVRIAAGDLGAPAYKKFDIEYWSPIENQYRELMSCSNVTDYQARRLNIRYRDKEGSTKLVHTLNGTAMAFSRTAIALIENHQDDQGNVLIPKALQTYMNGKETI